MPKNRLEGMLDGKEAVSNFLWGASDYMLGKWIKAGMPVRIEKGRWLGHQKNIYEWFVRYTQGDGV